MAYYHKYLKQVSCLRLGNKINLLQRDLAESSRRDWRLIRYTMIAFPLPLMSRFGPGRIIPFSVSHILDRIPNYVVLQPIHDSK